MKRLFLALLILASAALVYLLNNPDSHHPVVDSETKPTEAQPHQQTTIEEHSSHDELDTLFMATEVPPNHIKTGYCQNLTSIKRNLKTHQTRYAIYRSLHLLNEGHSFAEIYENLYTLFSLELANTVIKSLSSISRYNELNQSLLEKDPFTFKQFVKNNKHRHPFITWRKNSRLSAQYNYYVTQLSEHSDIKHHILQEAILEYLMRDQENDLIQALEEYAANYQAQFYTKNLLSDPYFIHQISIANERARHQAIKYLAQIEHIDSERLSTIKTSYQAIGDSFIDDYIDNLHGTSFTIQKNTSLQSVFDTVLSTKAEDNKALCQLYDEKLTEKAVLISEVKLEQSTQYEGCDESMLRQLPLVDIYSKLTAILNSAEVELRQFNDLHELEKIDLDMLKDSFDALDEVEKEFAYLLLTRRIKTQNRDEVINHVVEQGFYPQNANAAILFEYLNLEQQKELLNKLYNIDNPNKRNESLIYNILFISPKIVPDLIRQGYKLQHTNDSPDPLIKLLHYFPKNKKLTPFYNIINAMLDSGFTLNERHYNELYRLKLNRPNEFEELIAAVPEINYQQPTVLFDYVCPKKAQQ